MRHVDTYDIGAAVKQLNNGNQDGNVNFYSEHIKNASTKLYSMLAVLIDSMLIHGYTPHKLLRSTIIPIPKDSRASLKTSANYRGVALCNCICKIIDIVIINKYSYLLSTTDLQFDFESKHSTVICNYVLIETASYLTQRNTDVYMPAYWMQLKHLIGYTTNNCLSYYQRGICLL